MLPTSKLARELIKGQNILFIKAYLGMYPHEEESDYELRDYFAEALDIHDGMLGDPHMRKWLAGRAQDIVNDVYQGKFYVRGFTNPIAVDPIAFMEWAMYRDVDKIVGFLHKGEFYAKGREGRFVGIRNPIVHYSETLKMEFVESEHTWIQDIDGVVLFNAHSLAALRIGGADFDYDQISVYDNEILLRNIINSDVVIPCPDEAPKAKEKPLFDELHKNDEQDEDEFDVDQALPENPITRKGDIWLLGKHRLLAGDSTSEQDMATLMDGKKARLIVTDPPYNVAYVGKTKDALTIQNDKMDDGQFYEFLLAAYMRMYEVADDGASIYVFHADSEGLNFRKAHKESGFKLSQCCIWAKQAMVMGRQDYHWMHEPVLVGWKPTAGHYWNSDRKQTTLWQFDRPFRNEHHPTMKPIPLIIYPIKNSSKIGDIVLDSFGGSGSTLIACEDTDRICYTMELDEKYADVIVNRYIAHVGNDTGVYLIRDGMKSSYQETVAESAG
ncbi:DNA-methyltransferase [Paenibacillus agricola]|uniref:DNA-methyltransferase n=1 Tax=Paenibacillus agricola TaxID=2716264 RepID=UPI002892F215|nr:site-specific DNA-methyltransferase [Paenibacillus agricola]